MLRAVAESARLSNLPTVWTNVLVGAAAAGWGLIDAEIGADAPDNAGAIAWLLVFLLLAVSLMYTGGMFLNDAIDADWDAAHGRDRPIPSGRLGRTTVWGAGVACLGIGAAVAVLAGKAGDGVVIAGGLLAAVIVLYDVYHKRTAWCALLMGACRALVYPLAAAVVLAGEGGSAGPFALTWSFSLAALASIALLTLAARREDVAGARVGGLWAWMLPYPYLGLIALHQPEHLVWAIIAGAFFLAWCVRSARLARAGEIPRAVSGWLAGICLADAYVLMLLDRPGLAIAAGAAWLATVAAQRWIPGT